VTWTYFTAYLDGSRFITKAERDELFDNFNTLITGVSCSGGWSLDATEQAAVKSSLLITDRVALKQGATINFENLENALNDTNSPTDIYNNYSAVRNAALAAEGLTAITLNTLLTLRLDDYRLWNYYRRMIDGLVCLSCPTISSVTCRSRSATKTKCGHNEFGTPSSPPKKYLVRSQSGTITLDYSSPPDTLIYSNVYSGSETYSTSTCTATVTSAVTVSGAPSCSAVVIAVTADDELLQYVQELSPDCSAGSTGSTGAFLTVDSPTQMSGDASVLFPGFGSGTLTISLSSEYTTGQLETNCSAAVSAASWSAYGACGTGAYRDLSSDELTISLRMVEYKVTLSAATATTGCKLEWDVLLNGSFFAHNCVNLAAGVSQYDEHLDWPASNGEYTLANFAITPAPC
jgi:hypothetical protein